MKHFILSLTIVSLSLTSWGCVNTISSGTKYNGFPAGSTSRAVLSQLRTAIHKSLATDGESMEQELRDATTFEERNDYAVALMYLGRSPEAAGLLEKLEKEKPGEYSVAANLGTACELSGKNQEARKWIEEGIKRNSKSHEGTEWLHVKILDAKIAAERDPNYFKKHSVLELKAADLGDPVQIGDRTFTASELKKAILYQLTERLKFVKSTDAPVASLLFDYAAIEARTGTLETAEGILNLAEKYGYPADRVKELSAIYDRRIFWSGVGKFTVGIAAIISFLVLCYKKGWFVLSRPDLKKA